MKNIGLLLCAQVLGLLIPVIEIPILARSLGAESYGEVVMVQSIALLASLFMEYGFGISGARQISLASDDKEVTTIYGEVLSAKFVIAAPILILTALLVQSTASDFDAEFVIFGVLYFLAFGLSPMWLFQGKEQLAGFLVADLLVRLVGLLMLVIYIRDAEDANVALGIMASCAFFNTAAANMMCLKWVGRITISFRGARHQIRSGCHVFMYKSANNVLMSSGPALVSVIGGPQVLASYVPAEKVIKGFVGIAGPVLMGLFPAMIRLFKGGRPSLFIPVVITCLLGATGIVIATLILFFGEYLINTALGPGFEKAAEVMKIFIWVVPLRMVNQALGLTILLPMNKDKLLSTLTFKSSLVAIAGVIGFCMLYGAEGAAFGFILAEALLLLGLIFYIAKLVFPAGQS